MNSKSSRSNCRHCGKSFKPDYRNRHHQNYCPAPDCRRVSKAISQRRWLRKTQNHDYFRGPDQTRRVQQWRKSNPGYWKKKHINTQGARNAKSQMCEPEQKSCNAPNGIAESLQDVCLPQNPVLIGLISLVAGSTLQEDIGATMSKLVNQGRKILRLKPAGQCESKRCPNYDCQKCPAAGASVANIGQLWSEHLKCDVADSQQSLLPGLILHD